MDGKAVGTFMALEERNSDDVFSRVAEQSVQGLHTLAPRLRTRDSPKSTQSGGQNNRAHSTPNPKPCLRGPGPQPAARRSHVSAPSSCSALTHSTPSHASLRSAAQMHQAPPTLEPINEYYSLCLERSSPISSHGCLLLSCWVSAQLSSGQRALL